MSDIKSSLENKRNSCLVLTDGLTAVFFSWDLLRIRTIHGDTSFCKSVSAVSNLRFHFGVKSRISLMLMFKPAANVEVLLHTVNSIYLNIIFKIYSIFYSMHRRK